MARFNVPIQNPKPDIHRFLDTMTGKHIPEKPPLEEYLIDNAVMKPILTEMLGREWVDTSDKDEYMGGQMDFNKEQQKEIDAWLDNQIAFWYHMGYDFVRVEVSLPLPAVSHVTGDTAEGNQEYNRAWQGMEAGVIQSWEDFEKYPWPEITDNTFYIHQYICEHLPDGLGFMTCHAGGVYEHVSRLMGYEGLCYGICEQPDLVRAVSDKLGELIFQYNEGLLQLPQLSAIFQGDDFGFNTGTLIPPDTIRELYFPWHRRYAEQVHQAGRHYYLHSCGRVDDLMEELIEDIKLDGKHSFQDELTPIWEYKERWGERLALLGGVDVHKLATYDEPALRTYVREIIDKCAPGGRFAIGAGNSIPSYVSVENYLIMLDEARR
ncbi:MAG: uroporphyrinogen decarboxylase family protein [Bacteroidota bacterium]